MNHVTARPNIYGPIHKGLRALMAHTLILLGRSDWHDDADRAAALTALEELLDFCSGHLRHENEFVHTAMAARRPGSTAKVVEDHHGHEQAIAALRRLAAHIDDSRGAARDAAAFDLYSQLACFVAENYEHMHYEETHNNRVLWDAYSDADIMALHGRLVASLTPAETMQSMRWMLPNINHAERVVLLTGMRAAAPPPAFAAVLQMLQPLLSEADWSKLGTALELPQALAAAA
jgi:hypothetical protein